MNKAEKTVGGVALAKLETIVNASSGLNVDFFLKGECGGWEGAFFKTSNIKNF
jgi:hypothetical protein